MTIVGATDVSERVTLSGSPGYDAMPITDTPAGLRTALSQFMFDGADSTKKRESLAAVAAVENPLSHTAETVACVGCHVSTVVTAARATAAIDPLTLPGRYTSKFDLSTAGGKSAETQTTLRALGYLAAAADDLPARRQRHGADADGDRAALSGPLRRPHNATSPPADKALASADAFTLSSGHGRGGPARRRGLAGALALADLRGHPRRRGHRLRSDPDHRRLS